MRTTEEVKINLPATLDPETIKLPTPAEMIVDGAPEQVIAQVRKLAQEAINGADANTESGRELLSSTALKVSKSKVGLDSMLKNFTEDQRKTINTVNAVRRKIEEDLDKIRDEIKAPVVEWKTREDRRVAAHEQAIAEIEALVTFDTPTPSASVLRDRVARFKARQPREWEEYFDRASALITRVDKALTDGLARQEAHEREQAELAELRAERAKRIAEAEAEQRRKEQEAADRAAEERRKADMAAAAEQARIDAEQKAERDAAAAKAAAEAQLRAAEEKARLEREAAAAALRKAEEARKAAETKAEFERAQAEEQKRQAEILAEKRRLEAVEQERQRVEKERLAQEAEDKRRAADLEHRRTINGHILLALRTHLGYVDEDAKELVEAIVRNKVPYVTVNY